MATDLWRLRRDAGVSLDDLAAYSDLPAQQLQDWEREYRVPRKHAARLKWALWAAQRDQLLVRSGLPECDALEDLAAKQDPTPVLEHLETCDLCIRRSRFVEEHVGPMPAMGGGLTMRAIALVGQLSGWRQSAATGALFILALGGIGVPILLFLAALHRDPAMAAVAAGLFVVLTLSGAAGGIAYHCTAAMRRQGTIGHYGSSILTVYTYFAAVLGMLAIAASFVGWEAIDPDMPAMLSSPAGLMIWAVIGAGFGIVFGRAMRG